MAHSNVTPVALTGTDGQTINIGSPGSATEAATGLPGIYYGFSVRESGGTAGVTCILRDGTSSGTVLEEITLTAGQSASDFYGPQGLRVGSGVIYVHKTGTGTLEGSVRVG